MGHDDGNEPVQQESWEDRLEREQEERIVTATGTGSQDVMDIEGPPPGGFDNAEPSGIDRPSFTGTTPTPTVSLSQQQNNLVTDLRFYLQGVHQGGFELDEAVLTNLINDIWNAGQKAGMRPGDIGFAIAALYNTWAPLVNSTTGMRLLEPQPLLLGVDGGTHPETGAQLSWWTPSTGGLFEPWSGATPDVDNPGSPWDGLGFTGAGFSSRIYARPDEDEVRDIVRQRLKILVGGADELRVEAGLKTYMAAHRANFDRETVTRKALKGKEDGIGEIQQANPLQKVTEQIRTYGDYKQIHNLRPTDMHEDDWLTTSTLVARQSEGVTEQEATQRGITGAISGDATLTHDIFARSKKRILPSFFAKAAQNAGALGRGVK